MAQVTYSQRFNGPLLYAILNSPQGPLARDALRRGLRVQTQAKRNLAGGPSGPKRIDTGRLRSSIHVNLVTRNGELTSLVGTGVKYAKLVHDGTGIYGPRRRPIRPKTKQFLRFRPRRGGKWVYAKEVKGMKPNKFLKDALRAARR